RRSTKSWRRSNLHGRSPSRARTRSILVQPRSNPAWGRGAPGWPRRRATGPTPTVRGLAPASSLTSLLRSCADASAYHGTPLGSTGQAAKSGHMWGEPQQGAQPWLIEEAVEPTRASQRLRSSFGRPDVERTRKSPVSALDQSDPANLAAGARSDHA